MPPKNLPAIGDQSFENLKQPKMADIHEPRIIKGS